MIKNLTFLAEVINIYYDIHSVNPYIRTALYSVLRQGFEIKRRVIFDYELIYIQKGEFILNYNECDYTCKAGQFILIRPGIPHGFKEIKSELFQPHIHFDIVYRKESPNIPVSFKDKNKLTPKELNFIHKDIFEDYTPYPFVNFKNKDYILNLFFEIINSPNNSVFFKKSRLIQILEQLIYDNFPECFVEAEKKYSIAQQLKDYIDAGQGLSATLSDFEKQFSYSKYHIERQFKNNFGISLISYKNNKRMQMAENLLKTHTVSYVSQKLGFSSIYVFSRAYKKHFGYSPTNYQNETKTGKTG